MSSWLEKHQHIHFIFLAHMRATNVWVFTKLAFGLEVHALGLGAVMEHPRLHIAERWSEG